MIGVRRLAEIGTVHRSFGHRCFDFHDGGCFFSGLIGRVAGECEHFLHVLDVLRADGGEVSVIDDVVIAVGQGDAALVELGDLF